MSNYPAGAEFDPSAPHNQEDAKPVPYWVTVEVRIDAVDAENAYDQIHDWLKNNNIGGLPMSSYDWEIPKVQRAE